MRNKDKLFLNAHYIYRNQEIEDIVILKSVGIGKDGFEWCYCVSLDGLNTYECKRQMLFQM